MGGRSWLIEKFLKLCRIVFWKCENFAEESEGSCLASDGEGAKLQRLDFVDMVLHELSILLASTDSERIKTGEAQHYFFVVVSKVS